MATTSITTITAVLPTTTTTEEACDDDDEKGLETQTRLELVCFYFFILFNCTNVYYN